MTEATDPAGARTDLSEPARARPGGVDRFIFVAARGIVRRTWIVLEGETAG